MFDPLFHLAYLGPGGPEFLIVMLVLLVMFGAKDAPRILRKLNEIINQIRSTADGFKREVMYGDLNNEHTPDGDESPDNTDESLHNEDYDYDAEEDYYNYGEDDGGNGEEFDLQEEELKKESEQPSTDADEVNGEEEGGNAQKA